MRTISKTAARPDAPPFVFYYDGDCGFCTRSVRILQRLDWRRRVRWVPYQSLETAPDGLSWDDFQREAYIDRGGRLESGFFAFRRLTLLLPPLYPLAPVVCLPGVSVVGSAIYRLVARNRGRLTAEGCETEPPRSTRRR
jgi:predicted DCC family thiol-disulfide oxidoreductase YuxK